jgi:uncharacterized protein YgiB involved in biofilm formation
MSRMRKSTRVTLVLVGIAALAGCQRAQEPQRAVYASREDCLADWNNKPQDCTPATQPSHASHGFWYGPVVPMPMYYGGSSGFSSARSLGTTSASGSSSSITRGGFGSSARGSSGG